MRTRKLTVSYIYSDPEEGRPYPFIRLQGRWLEKLGFAIGSRIEVSGDDGVVVILLKSKAEE